MQLPSGRSAAVIGNALADAKGVHGRTPQNIRAANLKSKRALLWMKRNRVYDSAADGESSVEIPAAIVIGDG
jgi:hypothetical protein